MSDTTPEYLMKRIRQRHGYEEKDTSHDAELQQMSPMNKLRAVVAWELGDESWADMVINAAATLGVDPQNPD